MNSIKKIFILVAILGAFTNCSGKKSNNTTGQKATSTTTVSENSLVGTWTVVETKTKEGVLPLGKKEITYTFTEKEYEIKGSSKDSKGTWKYSHGGKFGKGAILFIKEGSTTKTYDSNLRFKKDSNGKKINLSGYDVDAGAVIYYTLEKK